MITRRGSFSQWHLKCRGVCAVRAHAPMRSHVYGAIPGVNRPHAPAKRSSKCDAYIIMFDTMRTEPYLYTTEKRSEHAPHMPHPCSCVWSSESDLCSQHDFSRFWN